MHDAELERYREGRGAGGGREPGTMATVEGRPAQYGVTLRQLRELMESRGAEGLAKINALGGPQDLCKKLYTSPTD
ncbi:plasma membrane calcium ATPase, partial [Danaus plexippus plexippus]